MLREPTISSPTKKRTKSSITLQLDSTAPVGIQVKTTRGEQNRHTLYFEVQYEEREVGFKHATSWSRTLWKDSKPNEIRRIKIFPPIKGGRQGIL